VATGTSGPKTQTIEFCYVYDRENVTACEPANTSNKLQVLFAGSGAIVHDVEIDPATIMVDINVRIDCRYFSLRAFCLYGWRTSSH